MFQPCSNYVIVYLYYIDIYFASRLVYFYSAEAFTSFHTTFFETTFWESIWGPAPWAIGAHKFGCLPLPLPFWSGRFCFEGPKPLVLFVFCGLKLLSFFGVNIHFISYFCLGEDKESIINLTIKRCNRAATRAGAGFFVVHVDVFTVHGNHFWLSSLHQV